MTGFGDAVGQTFFYNAFSARVYCFKGASAYASCPEKIVIVIIQFNPVVAGRSVPSFRPAKTFEFVEDFAYFA